MTALLPGYISYHLDHKFISKKAFYMMYMPMQMSKYDQLKQDFVNQNKNIDWSVGMIESACMFGRGWIGLADADGDKSISGDFIGYQITGDYSQMKSAYRKIIQDYPKACSFYNIYLTDPSVTPMDQNKTMIIFQNK